MRGNDWFPFHFDRVRKSKWWRRASDTARARSVMMWGEAYKAVPAGSLPDDDDELAEAAGYGMNVDAFLTVKDEIMSAWKLCSDGRWYHPTICEVVLETWEKSSQKRKEDAQRKRDQRNRARGVTPEMPDVTRDIVDVGTDDAETGRDIATQDKTGQTPPLPPHGGAPSEGAFETAFADYPPIGRDATPTDKAREAWAAAIESGSDPAMIGRSVVRFAESAGVKLDGGRRVPRFDRWLRERRWENFPDPAPGMSPAPWNGPPDLRAAVVARMGEPWAVSWLVPTRFQDVPARVLVTPRALVRERLMREVGDLVEEFRIQIVVQESAA